MSQGKPLFDNDDLISADALKPFKDLVAFLQQAVAEGKELAGVLNKSVSGNQLKSGSDVQKHREDTEKAKKAVDELTKAQQALAQSQEKLRALESDVAKERAAITLEINKQNQANKEAAILSSQSTSEYEKQKVRLEQLKRALKDLGAQGKEAPKAMVDEFQKLDKSVKSVEQKVGEFQRNVGNYKSATQELRSLTQQLVTLASEGKRGSDEFKEMAERASDLKREIRETKEEIHHMASERPVLDGLIGAFRLLTGGFEVAEGTMHALGISTEDWETAMVKLQAAMAITNGLQEIQEMLQHESALMLQLNTVRTYAAAAAQRVYAFATGGATAATNAFRIALISTGVGALVIALGYLISEMDLFETSAEKTAEEVKKISDAMADAEISSYDLQIRMAEMNKEYAKVLELQRQQKGLQFTKEVADLNEKYKEQLDDLRDLNEEKKKAAGLEGSFYYNGLVDDIKEAEKGLEAYYISLGSLREKYKADIEYMDAKFREDENKRSEDARKKAEEAVKKRADAQLANERRRIELLETQREREIATENLNYKQEYANAVKNGEDLLLLAQVHAKRLAEINAHIDDEILKAKQDAAEQLKAEMEKEINEQLALYEDTLNNEERALEDSLKRKEIMMREAGDKEKDIQKTLTEEKIKLLEEEIKKEKENASLNIDTTDKELELSRLKYQQQQEQDKEMGERKQRLYDNIAQHAISDLKTISDYEKNVTDSKLNSIDQQLNASQAQMNTLATLASQGQLNAQQSLAVEMKKQSDLQNERNKVIKQQQEQALILAGIEAFISAVRSGSKNPAGDAGSSIGGLLGNIGKSLQSLAGIKAFATGGLVEGDEQIVKINEEGEEYVIKASSVQKYGTGMLDDVNSGVFDPVNYTSIPAFGSYPSMNELAKEIREVKKAIQDKPVQQIGVSEIRALKEVWFKDNTIINKHYSNAAKLF